jgi:hypothetical protein
MASERPGDWSVEEAEAAQEPSPTKLVIDGNPGSGLIGDDDAEWQGDIACIEVEDCSHGGSIAMVTIKTQGASDEPAISAFTELTPDDVDRLIVVLTTIRATINPEETYDS